MDFEKLVADLYGSKDTDLMAKTPAGAVFYYMGGEVGHSTVHRDSIEMIFEDGSTLIIPKTAIKTIENNGKLYEIFLKDGTQYIINY